jgi:hypothetical protein
MHPHEMNLGFNTLGTSASASTLAEGVSFRNPRMPNGEEFT